MAMELIPFNFTAILLIFSSFIFLLIKARLSKPKSQQKLPPSPWKLPVIGHIHHLVGDLPHRALHRLSKIHGPVVHLQLGEVPAVVISSREAAKEVLKVQDPACADRPESIAVKILWYDYADIAFCAYNDYWRQMRKICIVELLSPKNVKSFAHIRQDEASRLIRSLQSQSGNAVNLTEKIFTFTSSITCRAAFGSVVTDHAALIVLFKEALAMAGGFELADLFPSWKPLHLFSWNKYKLLRMRAKMDSIVDRLVEEHKSKKSGEFGGEDIVDVLIRLQGSGELKFPITTDNIKALILDMFVAGSETSSTTTVWTMSELMRNPRVMEKVQAEVREAWKGKTAVEERDIEDLKYLKLVVKEGMRLHPPVTLLPRQSREECKAGGYSIPVKTKVMVNIWSLCRDPNYWDDPEIFHPERFLKEIDFFGNHFEFIPFGSGRRICPGLNFGLANVELPLAKLLYHFDWKLPPNKGIMSASDMTERDGITVSRKNPLFLVPTLCNPIPPAT